MGFELFAIGGFICLTLIIGLSTGRKVKTFRDYAVGRDFSTLVITCSLVATVSQGRTLNMISYYHRDGWWELLNAFILLLAIYFGSKFFIVRMSEFLGDLSVAESVGKLYGPLVRRVSSLFVSAFTFNV